MRGPAGACPNEAIAAQTCHHQAPRFDTGQVLSGQESGETGQTIGTGTQTGPTCIGSPVKALNIGSPVDGERLWSGLPKIERLLPGASGAQLIGKLIHDHHPNPHERPSRRFCVASIIESVAASSNQILN
jgi:hypothetical protein